MKLKFFAVLMFLMSAQAWSKEELTVIQTVSKDRRSFVVGKGIQDGVLRGQEIIFANDNVSIVCRAIEVNRNFSLWVPVDANITVPFNKEEIISSNSTVYGNVALEVATDASLVPELDYNVLYKKFRTENNFAAKIGYNKGLSQSSSSVADDRNASRVGYNLAIEYNYRFLPEFEMNFGARLDNEVYRIDSLLLDVPTKRTMVTMAATYHLINFANDRRNLYLSLAAGVGKSSTDVNGDESTGIVTLLPEARLGYLMPFSKTMALVFEASVESISSKEEFSDGAEQTTNLLNLKGSIGLRF